jgi:hypothetical protein
MRRPCPTWDCCAKSKQSTYSITYSMVQNPSWEATWFSARQIPAFNWTWTFLTEFTTARHLFLSWARSIQSMPPSHFVKTLRSLNWINYDTSIREINIRRENVWGFILIGRKKPPFSKTNRKYFKKTAMSCVRKYFRKFRGPIRSWRLALQNILCNRVNTNAVERELWRSWRMQASYVMKFPQYLPRRETKLKSQRSSQCYVLYYKFTASNYVP